ncbi:hypothetical protein C6503_14875 [Candidatus Poribacteria bacterium]|nr:MAG: hypothetical protein C6503_14875 [Candidatus Poribacteria bacterium]
MANSITRFFTAIWYKLTGRTHDQIDRFMENPKTVRNAYEVIIRYKRGNIQRYKQAIGMLLGLVREKENSLAHLAANITELKKMKVAAIAKTKTIAAELQKAEIPAEEIEQHPDYVRCVTASNDFDATLEKKNARVVKLKREIERAQEDIESHKLQLTILHRDLDNMATELSEVVADYSTERMQEEVVDMLSDIGIDSTSAELTEK